MMNVYNVVLRENLLGSPFAPNRRFVIDPFFGSLAIGGASLLSGAIGSLFNKGNNDKNARAQERMNQANIEMQRETNAQNAQLQRETNEQNYKIFQEQNAFNEDMWNKSNAYNSPEAQVERLKAAGINPAFVMGNGSMAEAGSIGSASANPMQAPQGVAPQGEAFRSDNFYQDLFSGIAPAVNAYFQNQLLNKQTQQADTDNQIARVQLEFKAQEILNNFREQEARIEETLSRTKVGSAEYDKLQEEIEDIRIQREHFKSIQDDLRKREKLQNDVMSAQSNDLIASATMKRAQARLTDLQIRFFPGLTQSQINLNNAKISEAVASAQDLIANQSLTSRRATAQYLENQLKHMELGRAKTNFEMRYSPDLRFISMAADYLTDILFSNIKLFK